MKVPNFGAANAENNSFFLLSRDKIRPKVRYYLVFLIFGIKKVNVSWVYRLMVHPVRIFAVMGEYDDIINLPHHVSKKHPQMTMWNRAAQFAPFAAVKGYEEAVKETVRKNEESYEPQYKDIQMSV